MLYTCQNCGVTAETPGHLCKPTVEGQDSKFCGTPSDQICDDKQKMMAYKCETCDSLAADADHLCDPSQIR